jgi:ribose/xylose/arabinose/galactoside ABC-type transport system permease subunit
VTDLTGATDLSSRADARLTWRRVLAFGDRNFVWVLLLLLFVVGTFANPVFASPKNLVNILAAVVSLGCLVLAQSLVLISGHMDLSTESIMIICAIIAGVLLTPPQAGDNLTVGGVGLAWPLVIPIMLLVGTLIGAFNGFMVAKLRMNPFMTTLGVLVALSGLSLVIGRGRHVINLPPDFRWIGSASIATIPVGAIVLLLAFAVVGLILNRTAFGVHLYAVGSNRIAARAAGINDIRVIIAAYAGSGLLCGLAAFLLVGRLGSADAGISSGNLFISIAAAVLGGVSLLGGRGTVTGMLGGLLLMGTITNALNIAAIDSTLINVVTGGIILLAVFVDGQRARRTAIS